MRFLTSDINIAAFLASVGFPMVIRRSEEQRHQAAPLAVFEFDDTGKLRDAIFAYESGKPLPAKDLLNTRTRLYRDASRVAREGVIL